MKNKFYSYEWKVNDGEWTSYTMDQNWTNDRWILFMWMKNE